ncbi:uroporphyrinogen-III C-methyltransferase [Vibrio sp. 10N.261.55.A7]|uniref:uroporphyrinogen-III C-methyltransferase n=1 Tax=Vibrio sp. 10N.261.55.A7 TaxID=1880851 RepID=UPI000C839ABC|nr:uroporphyrinogen-III C-methyltransferase [Vibrio sp. 10N.261.55.A7]PMJ91427.1 uroporphyrinogen-III C-methyltransferase [Vibrio sp. 10N.261.55.A7]
MKMKAKQYGVVTLVSAGPGDPELMTIKGAKAIDNAEVIIYDNLVSKEIRATFPNHAEKIYVGKKKGSHSKTQFEINELMIDLATQGKNLCRVKGGDAFVFGRGSEEMLLLAQNGVRVNVVPGITAASGCSTYSQIPLTHRGIAQGCTFITAHADKKLDIQWGALAALKQTLVVYMGLSQTDMIRQQLLAAGMDKETPIAFIEKGCTAAHRTITGTLADLTEIKEQHNIQSPALIVIGHVVSISEQMQWLEQRTKHIADSDQLEHHLRLSA